MEQLPSYVSYTHTRNQHSLLQRERELDKLMVRLGHPRAKEYLWARQAFDRLRYYATATYRVFTYLDVDNFSYISPPRLRILEPGIERLTQQHVQCHAATGWQRKEYYQLDYGCWHTRTVDMNFMAVLQDLLDIRLPLDGTFHTIESYRVYAKETYVQLCQLADHYQGRYLAQLRQPDPALLVKQIREQTLVLTGMLQGPDAWL